SSIIRLYRSCYRDWSSDVCCSDLLDMLATSLDADLARFYYLPALLEMSPIVPALLDAPASPSLRDAANRYLTGVNATVGAEMLRSEERRIGKERKRRCARKTRKEE